MADSIEGAAPSSALSVDAGAPRFMIRSFYDEGRFALLGEKEGRRDAFLGSGLDAGP